jgi:hypothetical protein
MFRLMEMPRAKLSPLALIYVDTRWHGLGPVIDSHRTPLASLSATQSTNTRKRRSPHARASSYR